MTRRLYPEHSTRFAAVETRAVGGSAQHDDIVSNAYYDALNHFEDEQALYRCFQCASAVSDGYFIFDLNTRSGLRRWNNVYVDESDEDALIITHGVYDGTSDKAWTRISGFVRLPNGLYERFEEIVFIPRFACFHARLPDAVKRERSRSRVVICQVADRIRKPSVRKMSER